MSRRHPEEDQEADRLSAEACRSCGLSLLACQVKVARDDQRCCGPRCDHRQPPPDPTAPIAGTVRDMLDAEASRQTAHIFLDAAAIHDRGDVSDMDSRDDMTDVALQRLTEVGAIVLTQDDETGKFTLDIARAGTGIVTVIVACLDGWAACAEVDRDELINRVRTIVDQHLTDEATD